MGEPVLSKIDYSILKATVTPEKVLKAAEETEKFGFATLCIFPKHIKVAREILPREKICAVIAFPLSPVPTSIKLKEIEYAVSEGAGELDIVADISSVKAGDWKKVDKELKSIRELVPKLVLKLIFECCYLTIEEKRTLCKIAIDANWDYLKTSTGYGTYGATAEDVEFLIDCSKGKAKVKAAGGIRNYESAKRFIDLGAERIGTSAGREIAEEVLHSR